MGERKKGAQDQRTPQSILTQASARNSGTCMRLWHPRPCPHDLGQLDNQSADEIRKKRIEHVYKKLYSSGTNDAIDKQVGSERGHETLSVREGASR